MEATAIDRKTFQVTEAGQVLGALSYEDAFFLQAHIKLSDSERYEIAPVGFLGTTIPVTKDGLEIAKLVMTWQGQVAISYPDGEEFIFRLNGFFDGKYIIENSNGELVIRLDPKFNWRKLNYNYDVSYDFRTIKHASHILLVLLGIYAANYFVACMSGASVGMM